ncbi:SEP domain-containing protein [Mycena belliarum]|uniref:SEP domain-containing protein n=1 Tax=Mycena belliarum TaxID=1033014 RepID=A0AAD6U7T7_9AGAR|nr:SEP domain-containing protein [Mycena belliae]
MASKENTNMEERRGGISLPPSTQCPHAPSNVTFWRNGFTFGEGPLMSYEDPKNAAVLQDILSGQVPPTLLDAQPGQLVELAVSKRTNEDYVAEPKEPSDDSEAGVV